MAVTLKQLAARAGVSIPTASLILNGKGQRYSEATRAKVLAVAAELRYRPNASARAIRQNRFNAAALLFREEQSFLPADLMRGAIHALGERQMHLVLDEMTLAEIEAEGAYTPRLLQQLCVDGLIVHHAKVIARGVQDMIRAQGIPAVWLHQCDEVDAVYPDDELAVHDCTTALLAAGHTRIAYLTFHPDTERRGYSSDLDRLAGYRSAMTAAGLEPQVMRRPHDNQVLYAGESSRDQRIAAARDLLKAQRPTAVLTRSTQELVPLLMAASELGIAVGSELLVITVEERLFSHAGVPVTTLVQPMHAIGAAAVEMLLAKIDAPDQPQPSRAIPYGGPRGAPLLGPPS